MIEEEKEGERDGVRDKKAKGDSSVTSRHAVQQASRQCGTQ